MVGHQAVGPDFDAATPAPLGHEADVRPIVVIAEESLLSAIAPLRNMMRIARHDDTCDSWHGSILHPHTSHVKKLVWCPPIGRGVERGVAAGDVIGHRTGSFASQGAAPRPRVRVKSNRPG